MIYGTALVSSTHPVALTLLYVAYPAARSALAYYQAQSFASVFDRIPSSRALRDLSYLLASAARSMQVDLHLQAKAVSECRMASDLRTPR